jgi:hypothetical protein
LAESGDMIRKLAATLFGAFFILAHQPNGNPVLINAETVEYIGPNIVGDSRAGSKVMVYGVWVFVTETPAEIKSRIDAALHQEGIKP